ncbi:MAG: MATE family efflux transporter [Myxococcaceae bacterium]|nr:MATE family efflux transporter [Myxococcaceae bacterium]
MTSTNRAQRPGELWTLTRLAVPLAAAQVGLVAMGFVDVAIVGRLGRVPLAAVGLGNAIFLAFAVVGQGMMMGLDPLVAQALGARDRVGARRMLWQGVWLALAVSAVVAIPIVLLPLPLEVLGVASDITAETQRYTWLRALSLPPMLLFVGVRSYLQAHRITWPMVVSVILANIANFFLDVVFVFGAGSIPGMGAAGAAVATVIGTMLQLGVLGVGLWTVRVPEFSRALRRMDPAMMKQALFVGLPVGLQMGAEVGVFALAGFLAARMSATAASAHQVAITLASVSFCVAVGVSSAGAVRVGHGIGAGDTGAARRSGLLAFALGGGFMAASALLFLLAPRWLASTLTDQEDILRAAVPLLAVAAAFQISDGLQAVGAGVLRGAGDTRFAFVANLIGHYGVGLPIALFAGIRLGLGVEGLWYGLAAGLTAVALALFVRFLKLSSKPIAALRSDRAAPAAH